MISNHEAEVILKTEMEGQSKNNSYRPTNCPPPPMPKQEFPNYIKLNWVLTAHKYTITFELVCHCLELCDLRKETVNFDSERLNILVFIYLFVCVFCRISFYLTL